MRHTIDEWVKATVESQGRAEARRITPPKHHFPWKVMWMLIALIVSGGMLFGIVALVYFLVIS